LYLISIFSVIIEIICDIREPIEEVNTLQDPTMETLINTKCLEIIKCLLERTDEVCIFLFLV